MDDKTPQKPEAADQDFRLIFSSLLAAYQPILAEDLELAKNPDKIQDPGEGPDCQPDLRSLLERKGSAQSPAARGTATVRLDREMALVLPAPALLHDLRLAAVPRSARHSRV